MLLVRWYQLLSCIITNVAKSEFSGGCVDSYSISKISEKAVSRTEIYLTVTCTVMVDESFFCEFIVFLCNNFPMYAETPQ